MRIFEDSNWYFKYYKRRIFSVTWQFSSILEEKKIISVAIGRVFFFYQNVQIGPPMSIRFARDLVKNGKLFRNQW